MKASEQQLADEIVRKVQNCCTWADMRKATVATLRLHDCDGWMIVREGDGVVMAYVERRSQEGR